MTTCKVGRRVFVDRPSGQGVKRVSGFFKKRSRGCTHKRARVSAKMQRWLKAGGYNNCHGFKRNDPESLLRGKTLCKKSHVVLPEDEEFHQ
ncbi:MAG: hypothetical protein WCT16_00600 [Candidatus Buchananbacteria bacterium]